MAKPKNKNEVLSTFNPKDLSDEKKAQILSADFVEFQKQCAEKLGMQIGIRLVKTENETTFGHQAIMVPVKMQPQPIKPELEKPVKENAEKATS